MMGENQKINCTVKSCAYQDTNTNRCKLQAIDVLPVTNCNTGKTDESMCGSYKTNA